jgi:hypothetical protein
MRNEELLEELDRRLKDQKEFINGRITGLSAVMREKFDDAKEQRGLIIEHQKVTNSRVSKLECQTRFIRWAHRNPGFAVLLTVFILLGVVFFASYFGVEALFKLF